jgi:hypothetical protein
MGPFRAVQTLNNFVYKVKHLISKVQDDSHISWLRWHHDPSLNVTADLKDQISHDGQELQMVENFMSIRQKGNMWQVQTKWLGCEEPTWEGVRQMLADVPELIGSSHQRSGQRGLE